MRRLITLYNGFQFFHGLLLWLPVFYEYQKRMGLSDQQIFGIQSVYYIAFCLMEIPTGLVADRWGYRRCLKLGAVLLVFSNLLPVFAPTYWGMLVHFLVIALSRSFISGASSAYLYEALAAEGQGELYKEAEGRARAYGLFGKVLCWAGIGYLMEWHITLPYWLTALNAVLAVGFAWRLPAIASEEKAVGSGADSRSVWFAVREGIQGLGPVLRILGGTPLLVLVMFQGIALFVLARIISVNLFQPILGAKGFELASHGVVMSAITIFEAIGSARPQWIRRMMDDLQAVFGLTVIMALSVGVLPWCSRPGVWVALSVFSFAVGISFPIQRQLLNDSIPDSRYRATLISVESILDRAVCAWAALLVGEYASGEKLDQFLLGSAWASVALMGMLVLAMRFAKSRRRQAA